MVVLAEFIDAELPPEPPPPPAAPRPELVAPRPVSPRLTSRPERSPPLPPDTSAVSPKSEPQPLAAVAQTLTQEREVLDLSNTVVVGGGASHGGGRIDTNAKNAGFVRALGMPAGADVGVAPGRGQAQPGRACSPRLAGGASWSCPFPREADVDDVNQATVALRVSVNANGSVRDVSVSSEPGYGFGRAAKRCALTKHWAPGLDTTGRVIGTVAVVNVRFVR